LQEHASLIMEMGRACPKGSKLVVRKGGGGKGKGDVGEGSDGLQ